MTAAVPSRLGRFAAGLATFVGYRQDLRPDVVADLSVAALALPVGIAYAEIAHVPAVVGIYSAIFPLFAYALFGSSRQLITGPDAATCLMAAVGIGTAQQSSSSDLSRARDPQGAPLMGPIFVGSGGPNADAALSRHLADALAGRERNGDPQTRRKSRFADAVFARDFRTADERCRRYTLIALAPRN